MMHDLQKASFGKRISAYIFDFIMLLVLATGFAFLVSAIVGFDGKMAEMEAHYHRYEEEYGVVVDIGSEEYNNLTEDERARYDAAAAAFEEDEEVSALNSLIVNLMFIIVSVSVFLSYLVWEFIIPLFFGNGQTVGKKIFALGVMRDDSVKITPFIVFVRAILGKYTIETMVPLLMLVLVFAGSGFAGLLALVLLAGLQIGLLIKTKNNSAIHDMLAYTVVIDLPSQMIFESKEAMIEYKQKIHAEMAAKKDY